MFRASAVLALVLAPGALFAIDADHDFSGKWILDTRASHLENLGAEPEASLAIVQHETAIQCATPAAKWSYLLDGTETRYRIGDETRASVVKWEGAALLIDTIVSGPKNYTIMDRWRLSRDHAQLTVVRQIVRREGQVEATLIYAREGQPATTAPTSAAPQQSESTPAPQQALVRQPAAPPAGDFTISKGTRLALSLRNTIDTKHSRDGDHVYLETIYPVTADNKIVIPKGSFVNGTVTESKRAGHGKGKSELYIRFDTLILPNGVTRDFRSRLGSADSAEGKVDREEGKVTGERDKAKDARTVATTTGAGAGIGGIAGASAGHGIEGLGVGSAAGAAVGLAAIFNKRGPDASLPRGTVVEMILDRDLHFTTADLNFRAESER